MEYTITDAPANSKYPWHKLLKLPAGKALRLEFPLSPLYLAENARSTAIAFCRKRNIQCTTKRVEENGVQALYIWRT